MISKNPLRVKVLTTSDEVVFHAPTASEMDPRMINQNIIIAERRFIKPALGTTLYNLLAATKNILVTPANITLLQAAIESETDPDREAVVLRAGDYVNSDTYFNTTQLRFWQEHLAKVTAEAVYFVTLPVARTQLTSKGVIKNFPEIIGPMNGEAVSSDMRDLKHLMDRSIQDRISPLLDDMHEYLCAVAYPGYEKDCGCGKVPSKKADIVFGLYDDIPCRNCDDSEETITYSTGRCTNESIPFYGVSFVDINWTLARQLCFGEGAVIQVEIQGEDGVYRAATVDIVPDDIYNTTMYHIDLGGEDVTGRVLIS